MLLVRLIPLLLIGALRAGSALAADPFAATRAGHFAEAEAAVADAADPLLPKLVNYYRLLAPDGGGAAEIADFRAANPDWPNQALLEHRREEAILREPDDAARAACLHAPVSTPRAEVRCADALAAGGGADPAAEFARRAWIDSPEAAASAGSFLARWQSALRPEDEAARFERLVATDNPDAAAQVARLAAADRPAARARLALRHDAPNAAELLAKLPEDARDTPAMVLEQARWLRRAKLLPEALALWTAKGMAAEQAASADRRAAFWAERNILARRLLVAGDAAGAYAMADDTAQTGAAAASAYFLAGFIALRRNHDPAAAATRFERLAGSGKSAITRARAHYWLARALAAAGNDASPENAKAAQFPLTFYGQLAARALGDDGAALGARIRALTDPPFDTAAAWTFLGRELARAAVILVAEGEFGRARGFLARAQETTTDPAQQSLAAHLALGLDMPDAAVAIARRMGAEGLALPVSGWPEAVSAPSSDAAVILALIRQESSFDAGVVSAAGARGLMQLMPGTADVEAKRAGGSVTEAALTTDPARNVELGASYLRRLVARFGGYLPLAIAAYNAGPQHVEQWLRDNGDPRTGQVDMIDWIELIPFEETRNYVQRVLENVVIYQARRGEDQAALTSQWMR